MILVAGVLLEIGLSITDQHVNTIENSWESFEADRSEKGRLETTLLATLGYGRMIHNFKNLIIRQEPKYADRVRDSLGAAQAVVDQYRILGLSAIETAALDDIDAILKAYRAALLRVEDGIRAKWGAISLDAVARVDDSTAFEALETLRALHEPETSEHSIIIDKSNLASRLRHRLGYGGMTHNFKNFVIRQNSVYLEQAKVAITRVNELIAKWRNLSPTVGENTALNAVEETVSRYRAGLDKAESLAREGMTIERIDTKIRVDDTRALRALDILDREIAEQINQTAIEVKQTFLQVSRVQDLLTWSMRILVGVLVFLAFWLMHRMFIEPIRTLANAMTELAAGNSDVYVPGREMENEVGVMAKAFAVFKSTAISRAEAEERLASTNEELQGQILELRHLREQSEEQAGMAITLAETLDASRVSADKIARDAEANEQRIRSIVDTVNDAIITIGSDGKIESFNRAAEKMFEYSLGEAINLHISVLLPDPDAPKDGEPPVSVEDSPLMRVLGQMTEREGRKRDGTLFPAEIAVNLMRIDGDAKFTGVIRDITERRAAEAEVRRLALTDPLTGLANRNQFQKKFDEAIELAKRRGDVVGLMMLDLDKFKPVNDTYGHPVGDALLIEVSEKLNEIFRTTDTVARLGGDEFAIILVDPDSTSRLALLAERVIETISAPTTIDGHSIQIGTSIGISHFPDHGKTPADLVVKADKALYAAKYAGRNTHRFYDAASDEDDAE